MNPLVSILIPAYNAERWVADTIQSALGQTWPAKEIIVVDDGSTDRTLANASRFSSKEVIVVTQSNQGASAARNKAFSLCHGDYIQWLDADDLLAPDKIARQMEAALQCPGKRTLFSSAWGSFFYRASKSKFAPSELWTSLSPTDWLLLKFEKCSYMPPAVWLVSRELTEAAGPWNTRLLGDDDGEYFFRVIMHSEGIRFVPAAKAFYRRTGSGSLSYIGLSNSKMEAQFLGMKMQIGYLRSMKDDKSVRAACVSYLQIWLRYFYPNRPDIIEQAQQLAHSLGGQLEIPRLSRKYAWIRKTLGWSAARQAQINYNEWKSSVLRTWDNTLFHLEKFISNEGS
jgi:glycosyltransferase involved in cell wall biosynthesis